MINHEEHPTWQAIPQQYRSVWYRVPGYENLDRRGKATFHGTGLIASSAIEGIRTIGDIARSGDIIPFRYLDTAVLQGRHLVFLRDKPAGYGLIPVDPTETELILLYEKYPAMKPVEKLTRKDTKAKVKIKAEELDE